MRLRHRWLLLAGVVVILPVATAGAADKTPAAAKAGKKMTAVELAAFIDAQVAHRWKANKVKPAPLADDAEYMRRLSLDLLGRIPRVSDARKFFGDKSFNKRAELVERYLTKPPYVNQYINHFTNKWRRLMIPKSGNIRTSTFANNFERWLVQKVRDNTPYDQMARELITGQSNYQRPVAGQPYNPYANSAMAFYQAYSNKPEEVAAATSRIFLGVRLECAQCHDHPFADWSRNQFWEYTAFFGKISVARINPRIQPRPGTQPRNISVNLPVMKIPGTRRKVNARFLDGKVPYWEKPQDPRVVLADWMISSKNKYFARTAVNRLWAHFMGHGIIDPVDEEPSETNPNTHPVLLNELARQFVANKYDVKYIIRAITLSKTYQRSSTQTDKSQEELRLFARSPVRGLTGEQLFDSLAQAVGFQENVRYQTGNIFLNQRTARGRFLNQFESTERATEKQTSILQALALMNGKFITDATSVERSQTLAAVINSPFFTTKDRLETLYLATLTRYPRPEEVRRLTKYVQSGGPRNDPDAALADVFWALINSSEFSLNH